MTRELLQKSAAECFGTFCLVFAGTGAIVINEASHGAISHVGIALTFGLVVMAMIYAIGDITGCHLNPAVTVGLYAVGKMERRYLWSYIVSQTAGAFIASVVLRILFPGSANLGATIPAGSVLQSFVLEWILTFILMVVIMSFVAGSNTRSQFAGIAIGGVIALEAMFAGPICGASMNPARSFAPAIVSMNLGTLWIYIVAPILGAISGAILGVYLFVDKSSRA